MSSLSKSATKKLQRELAKLSAKQAALHAKKHELNIKIADSEHCSQQLIIKINDLNKQD